MIRFKDYKTEQKTYDCLQDGVEGIRSSLYLYKHYGLFTLEENVNILDRMEKLLESISSRTLNTVSFNKTYHKLIENYGIDSVSMNQSHKSRIRVMAENTVIQNFMKKHSEDIKNIYELYTLLQKADSILAERLGSQGTLNIFDIDDTLFKTNDKIAVVNNGKVIKKLDTGAFAKYKLQSGEKFDFSDLRNGKNFYNTAQPIKRMLVFASRLVRFSGPQSRSVIITARGDFNDKNSFLQKFRDSGFPIDKVYVFRAGNNGDSMPTDQSKKVIIDQLLSSGKYDTVRMWDDSVHNLDTFLQMKRSYSHIKFEAFKVDPATGTTSALH